MCCLLSARFVVLNVTAIVVLSERCAVCTILALFITALLSFKALSQGEALFQGDWLHKATGSALFQGDGYGRRRELSPKATGGAQVGTVLHLSA